MNKSTLGTIVGAALLGLAKSKIGGRNEGKPHIVPLDFGHVGHDIFIHSVPEDIKGIVRVYDNERQYFLIPSTAVISFMLESTSIEFPEYPQDQIDEYRDDCKRWYFDENEELEDDDEEKQDWEELEDVPDHYVEDLVEEKKEAVDEDYSQQCYNIVAEFTTEITETILFDIEHIDGYFERCKRFIGNRNVYLTVSERDTEWEENGFISVTCEIMLNSDNPLFVINFLADLDEYLSDKDEYNNAEDVSLHSGPKVEESKYAGGSGVPKLRKR